MFRGPMSREGLHFMNFPAPVALLPSQQLGLGPVVTGGGEGQMGIMAALNAYRQMPVSSGGVGATPSSEPVASQQQQHGGNDRLETMSNTNS